MFISFCGIDGCGKTTQAKMLCDYLESLNIKCKLVHGFRPKKYSKELKNISDKLGEDFHTCFSSDMRTFSFLLDLLDITNNVILPSLNEGYVVIAEKYFIDTIIYAPILGTNQALIDRFALCIPRPDINLFLSITPEIAVKRTIERAKQSGEGMAPKESLQIASIACNRYKLYVENHSKFISFNAEKPILELHNEIIKSIKLV